MKNVFQGLDANSVCIEDFWILIKGDWTDHVQTVELTLDKLKEKIHKCNVEKCLFGQTKMEYLYF